MKERFKVHLVDGTYELFRSYFGAPSSLDANGREVGATRGFLRTLTVLLREPDVTHVACAFDHVVESFRNDLFDGYKTGEGLEPEILAQFPLVERAAVAMGVVVWPMVEFEADDALAAGAARFSPDPRVEQVVLCTPDKDLAQCVEGERVVCLDRARRVQRGEDGVMEKFGVLPTSIPDYLALVGDTADGIPGIKGWGAKSASTVLARYGHLEIIPTDASRWDVKVRSAAKLAERLTLEREDALLYRKLATLRVDVPLEEDLDDLEWRGARRDLLERLCHEIDDQTFVDRVDQWRSSPPA